MATVAQKPSTKLVAGPFTQVGESSRKEKKNMRGKEPTVTTTGRVTHVSKSFFSLGRHKPEIGATIEYDRNRNTYVQKFQRLIKFQSQTWRKVVGGGERELTERRHKCGPT